MSRIHLLFIALLVCALTFTTAFQLEDEMDKPIRTRPLIDSPGNNDEKRQKLTFLADVVKTEPSAAKLDAAAEDEWNGEDGDGENRFQKEQSYKSELTQLRALVGQTRQLIAALPSKTARIRVLKAKLDALRNEHAKEDALERYRQQKALLRAISKKQRALKNSLGKLKKSESALQVSMKNHEQVLEAVGAREEAKDVA